MKPKNSLKKRKLITGKRVQDASSEAVLIHTRCPAKWACADLETGEVWRWDVEGEKPYLWFRLPTAEAGRILAPKASADAGLWKIRSNE